MSNFVEQRRPRQSRSKIKVMLTVFFDYRGVVHYEFLPTGQNVNKEYYLSIMRHLSEAIRKKNYGPTTLGFCTTIMHRRTLPWFFVSFSPNTTYIAPQPPYSPDLAPCDFWLFPKLKRPLRGNRLESIEDIEYTHRRLFSMLRRLEETLAQVHWCRGGIILRETM